MGDIHMSTQNWYLLTIWKRTRKRISVDCTVLGLGHVLAAGNFPSFGILSLLGEATFQVLSYRALVLKC